MKLPEAALAVKSWQKLPLQQLRPCSNWVTVEYQPHYLLFLILLHADRKGDEAAPWTQDLHKGVFIVWFSAVEYCQQVFLP